MAIRRARDLEGAVRPVGRISALSPQFKIGTIGMLAEHDLNILRELLLQFHQDIEDLFDGYDNLFRYFVDSSDTETVSGTIAALDRLLALGLSDSALRNFALEELCSGLPKGSPTFIFESFRSYLFNYATICGKGITLTVH